jgi:hypothetical protein
LLRPGQTLPGALVLGLQGHRPLQAGQRLRRIGGQATSPQPGRKVVGVQGQGLPEEAQRLGPASGLGGGDALFY